MRIAFFTEYSWPNIDGVWNRVYNESIYLKKRHKIFVFSSNLLKPSSVLKPEETYQGISLFRFPVRRITENASFWPAKQVIEKLEKIKPDIIVCNNRHPEVKIAMSYAQEKRIPCLLITHAPFLEKGIRNPFLNLLVKMYDKTLDYNRFDKILAITRWEIPYLLKLGVKKDKIVYMPNPIPDAFFKKKKKITKKNRKLIFLGRITEIKDIETLLLALGTEELELVGPISDEYRQKLNRIIRNLQLKVHFSPPIYNLKEKIKKLLSADIFVLPSKREGMPQSLLEAMALGLVPVASKNQGAKEIVNEKNGFLFDISSSSQLRQILDKIKNRDLSKISLEARKTAENFKSSKIMKEIEKLYVSLVKKSY